MWRIIIKTFSRIWNILLYFIIFIEIVLLTIFALPNIFGIRVFTVSSGSMIPKYNIGSIIYVKKAKPSDIKIGDSITFYIQGSSTVATHEVYEISEDSMTYRTQGINNKDENGAIIHDANPTTYGEVVGKVVFCIPVIGVIFDFLSNIPILCTLIIITIIMVLTSFFMSRGKDKNVNKSIK